MTKNFTLKKIPSLLGVILIGAIGSGLWDVLLKDFMFYLGELFVKFISHFYSGYIDSLYKNIGTQLSFLTILPSIFIILFIILLPFLMTPILLRKFDKLKPNDSNEKQENKRILITKFFVFITHSKLRFKLFLIAISIPLIIIYTDIFIKELTSLNAVNYVERTIEIIRPYISQSEYLKLRSEFRLINNSEKFNTLIFKITDIANKTKINLPESKFYGLEKKQ